MKRLLLLLLIFWSSQAFDGVVCVCVDLCAIHVGQRDGWTRKGRVTTGLLRTTDDGQGCQGLNE
jgi:hypothetical protein